MAIQTGSAKSWKINWKARGEGDTNKKVLKGGGTPVWVFSGTTSWKTVRIDF